MKRINESKGFELANKRSKKIGNISKIANIIFFKYLRKSKQKSRMEHAILTILKVVIFILDNVSIKNVNIKMIALTAIITKI
ncbi:MAG TPA: hypothetical protein PK449_01380 [Exilispira sp.]|nr:hypothetical protein [Exilispira sp.]